MEDGFLLAFGIVGVLTLAAMVCFSISITNGIISNKPNIRKLNRRAEKAAREERRHLRVMTQISANY